MSADYKKVFSKNLSDLMALHNKTQADLISDLKINKSTISTWINGTKMPRMNKIEMLSKYFGVEKSDLLESHDTIIHSTPVIPNDLNKFLSQAQVVFDGELYNLDDEDRQLIMKSLEVAFAAAKHANKRKK